MNETPGTPQTLPCDEDEDPFLFFRQNVSFDDHGFDEEIVFSKTATSSPHNGSKSTYQRSARCHNIAPKKLDFNAVAMPAKTATENKHVHDDEPSVWSNMSLPASWKHKRRKVRTKSSLESGKLFSSMVNTVMQSRGMALFASLSSEDKSKRYRIRNASKLKDRLYYCLEDNEEDPLDDFEDDRTRTSAQSLPARIRKSMPWNKKPSTDSSSASVTSLLLPKASKRKWNRLIQADSLASFKTSDMSSTSSSIRTFSTVSSRTKLPPIVESSSSVSTVSSIASWNSSLASRRSLSNSNTNNGDKTRRFVASSHRLVSMLQQGLYISRVDEEEDEDFQDEDHPAAGSFAFAIGMGEC